MLKSDFKNEDAMREHMSSLYEKARQSRRMLLKLDIRLSSSDRIKYKGTLQWLDSMIEELMFEDEPETK